MTEEKENLRSFIDVRGSILKWFKIGAGRRVHHVLRSKSGTYAIMIFGEGKREGSIAPGYSFFYLGFSQAGEFRLEGLPGAVTVFGGANGDLVADYSHPIIRFNDSRKSMFKRKSGVGAMPSKRVKASHWFDFFYDERDVEQLRIERGYDPRLWIGSEADWDCLPILILLSRYVQLKEAEFTYSIGTPIVGP